MTFSLSLHLLVLSIVCFTGSIASAFEGPQIPLELEKKEVAVCSPCGALESPVVSQDEAILVEDMQGLILVASPELVVPCPLACQGVVCLGVEAPGGNEGLIECLTPIFLHRPLTSCCIDQLKREIILYYRARNHPLVMVFTPEQTVANRVLQLVVVEACLGKVVVTGNCFTPQESFMEWVRVDCGGYIDERLLLEDVSWMNTNPFRRVNILYTPGELNGTTDIELNVTERKPWRIYAGTDNTGTPSLGQQRFFAGCNIANIFYPDNIFSYQYTTSPNFHRFQSHTFQFVSPFPWRDTLSLFGGYATAHPRFVGPFHTDAKTSQFSGRYTMPQWWAQGPWLSQCNLDMGFDYKTTNSNLFFGEDNLLVTSNIVWISQLVFGGQFARSGTVHRVQGGAEFFWSPGEIFPHQTDADFSGLRPGATAQYFYGKFNYSHEAVLPFYTTGWIQGRLQLANANLLASEQFSLGGYSTVRGYNERIVNGDNAYCLNFELRTLPIQPHNLFPCLSEDSLILLAFFDIGHAWDHEQIPGFPLAQTLIGVGSGFRYRIGSYFSSRLDVGVPLHRVQDETMNVRLHFGLVLSY